MYMFPRILVKQQTQAIKSESETGFTKNVAPYISVHNTHLSYVSYVYVWVGALACVSVFMRMCLSFPLPVCLYNLVSDWVYTSSKVRVLLYVCTCSLCSCEMFVWIYTYIGSHYFLWTIYFRKPISPHILHFGTILFWNTVEFSRMTFH